MVEVLKYAPAELNPTERLTLVAIAESCRSDTRLTFYREGWDAAELARRVGVTAESLTKVFRSLARRGYEVRVAHTVKDGKPVFAFKGKQTTFLLPKFGPQRVDERPVFSEGDAAKGWTSVRERLDESPGNEPQRLDESPPLLFKDLPSKNPSSLSPREDDAPAKPSPDQEREVDASQEQPEPHNPIAHLLIKNGCPTEQVEQCKNRIDLIKNVLSDGWYFTADRNGSLRLAVGEALEDLTTTPARSCDACADTGAVGDWMNSRPCDCLWWKDPGAARKAFVALLKDFPDCGHGTAGGDMRAPNGWQHCSLCRGPGWVDRNDQGRTDDKAGSFKRSTSVLRAEQALAVADDLDRQFGHGRYAPGQIRSPADQRVADGQALYDHYKNLEEPA